MQTLREFFTSSSGLAPARQGLGLGWVISALTGVAVLLGAKKAESCDRCTEIVLWEDCWNDPVLCPEDGKHKYCKGEKQLEDCSIVSFSYCTS